VIASLNFQPFLGAVALAGYDIQFSACEFMKAVSASAERLFFIFSSH
jgi:hypothetical protein